MIPTDPRGTANRIFKMAVTSNATELAILLKHYRDAKIISRTDRTPDSAIRVDYCFGKLDMTLRTLCHEVWTEAFGGGQEADAWLKNLEEIGPEDSISSRLTDLVNHYIV